MIVSGGENGTDDDDDGIIKADDVRVRSIRSSDPINR